MVSLWWPPPPPSSPFLPFTLSLCLCQFSHFPPGAKPLQKTAAFHFLTAGPSAFVLASPTLYPLSLCPLPPLAPLFPRHRILISAGPSHRCGRPEASYCGRVVSCSGKGWCVIILDFNVEPLPICTSLHRCDFTIWKPNSMPQDSNI